MSWRCYFESTGAAGAGIGQAIARRLAAGGATVIVTDIHEERTRKVSASIARDYDARVLGYPMDVADRPRVDEVVAAVHEEVGPIRILVNNAAINIMGDIFDYDPEDFERVLAVDLSPEAVEATGRNAERLGAEVEVLAGEGLELLEGRAPFDLVVSNPPYVEPGEAELLSPEVREFEPGLALFAPAGDPDYFVRELAGRADRWLAPGGAMLVELGHRQSERALELSRGAGLEVTCHEDLERVPRVLELTRPGSE